MSESTHWWLKRPALNWAELIGIAVVLALAGGALGAVAVVKLSPTAGSCDAARLSTAVLPSVVTIFVTGPSGSGSGSGAVIRADGVVLTNDHVIAAGATSGRGTAGDLHLPEDPEQARAPGGVRFGREGRRQGRQSDR